MHFPYLSLFRDQLSPAALVSRQILGNCLLYRFWTNSWNRESLTWARNQCFSQYDRISSGTLVDLIPKANATDLNNNICYGDRCVHAVVIQETGSAFLYKLRIFWSNPKPPSHLSSYEMKLQAYTRNLMEDIMTLKVVRVQPFSPCREPLSNLISRYVTLQVCRDRLVMY